MSRHPIEITYALETTGPLHIGTGRGAGGLHRAMLLDHHGFPYIPGSTIKGRARYAAVRICEWMGLKVYRDAVADVLRENVETPNGPQRKPDLPSRLFGSAWHRCTLRFSDARLQDTDVARREVRTGAARSRLLGTVSHRRLYQSEFAPPGLVFGGSIRGYLDFTLDQPGDAPVEALVLWLALHLMVEDGIGGSKSAGCGRLRWSSPEGISIKIDGTAFNFSEDDSASTLELLPDLQPQHEEASE